VAATTLQAIIEKWDALKVANPTLPTLHIDQTPEDMETFPSATVKQFTEGTSGWHTRSADTTPKNTSRNPAWQFVIYDQTVEDVEAIAAIVRNGFLPNSLTVTGWNVRIFEGTYAVQDAGLRDQDGNHAYMVTITYSGVATRS
jgi:hypothetical protein